MASAPHNPPFRANNRPSGTTQLFGAPIAKRAKIPATDLRDRRGLHDQSWS